MSRIIAAVMALSILGACSTDGDIFTDTESQDFSVENTVGAVVVGALVVAAVGLSDGTGGGYEPTVYYRGSSYDADWDYLPASGQYRCRAVPNTTMIYYTGGEFVPNHYCNTKYIQDTFY